MLGIYAGDAAIERAGLVPYRDALAAGAAAAFNDRTGLYVGSGGGAYEHAVRVLPADDRSRRRHRHASGANSATS